MARSQRNKNQKRLKTAIHGAVCLEYKITAPQVPPCVDLSTILLSSFAMITGLTNSLIPLLFITYFKWSFFTQTL